MKITDINILSTYIYAFNIQSELKVVRPNQEACRAVKKHLLFLNNKAVSRNAPFLQFYMSFHFGRLLLTYPV